MTKPTNDELARAHDQGDWHALWLAAQPLVKFTIRRMMQRGELDSARWNDMDLRQEGLLAAGAAVRSWNTLEGAFSTWVSTKIRGALLNHLARESRGGLGGGGDVPLLISAEEPIRGENGDEDEDEEGVTRLEILTYPEDEVLPSPETAVDRANAVRLLEKAGPVGADVLRRLCGIGCDPQTITEVVEATGVSRWNVESAAARLGRLLTKLG